MEAQLPPTRKDRMMRRNLFFLNELWHVSAHKQSIKVRFEQHPSLVAETREPPVGVLRMAV
jgi:hypothetical protein